MKILMTVVLGLVISLVAGAANSTPGASNKSIGQFEALSEGLPLPWPFPWAKDCPVDWKSMQGRYLLSGSAANEQIEFKITVITIRGFRLVRMTRFSRDGKLLAQGFTFVTLDQRSLRMHLVPQVEGEEFMTALIKLHYSDAAIGCAKDHLVPILTLERSNSSSHTINHYRLVPLDEGSN